MKTLTSEEALKSQYNQPNPQYCPHCNKLCKSINSYKQHICRCKNNPNRIESARRDFAEQYKNLPEEVKQRMAWSKGLTKEVSNSIRLSVEHRPPHSSIIYVYEDYNLEQIQKWLSYIKDINVVYDYELTKHNHNEGYKIISSKCVISDNGNFVFEHDFIANILLGGKLSKSNTVHHIDKDRTNNSKDNLMVFVDSNNHKRFHNSKYAKLVYDENTHLFSCYIDKS